MCDHDVSFLPFPSLIFLKVIGAASKEKLDVVKSMGASAVIDYNTDSIKEKVMFFIEKLYGQNLAVFRTFHCFIIKSP